MKYEGDRVIRSDGDLMLNGSDGFDPCGEIAWVAWPTHP